MITLKSYKTPQEYLNETQSFLEERELENNLILGVCLSFPDKTKKYDGSNFLSCFYNNKTQSTAINNIPKVVVYGITDNKDYIKPLVEYYKSNKIKLDGVNGITSISEIFSHFYHSGQIARRILIVHKLTKVNELPLASGKFEAAKISDLELITNFSFKFQEEAKTFPQKTKEKLLSNTENRIKSGSLYNWIDKGNIVSIAAINRRTKNSNIIGLVYTPDEFRGNGYATSCVQKLSEHILQSGYKNCGLFTDKSNPTSNSIYKRIGYKALTEFSDIEFL